MKKTVFVVAFIISLGAVSVALAAVSSPCGARRASPPSAPVVMEELGAKRDVLGHKIPVETQHVGDSMNDVATKYNDTLITGKGGSDSK